LANQNNNRRPRRRLRAVITRSAVRVHPAAPAKSKLQLRREIGQTALGNRGATSISAAGGAARRRLAFTGDHDTLICQRCALEWRPRRCLFWVHSQHPIPTSRPRISLCLTCSTAGEVPRFPPACIGRRLSPGANVGALLRVRASLTANTRKSPAVPLPRRLHAGRPDHGLEMRGPRQRLLCR
jgi:hypothetical protein